MYTQQALINAINSVSTSFSKDELAYLALTSKAESPIRDKIAFHLNNNLSIQGLLAAREWKRRDVAIINNNIAVCLIELTLMYTCDAVKSPSNLSGFANKVLADVAKAKATSPNADIYAVLLATHPKSIIQKKLHLSGVIQYSARINSAIKKYSSNFSQIAFDANNAVVNNQISQNGRLVYSKVINAGCAFGINTEVMIWLMKF